MHARVKQPFLSKHYFDQSKHCQGEIEAARPGWSHQHQTSVEEGIKLQDHDIILSFVCIEKYC